MTDDLVKRLRFGSLTTKGSHRMNLEAADRIEALQAERCVEVRPLAFEQNGQIEGSLWAQFEIGHDFSAYYTIEPDRKDYSRVEFGISCHEFGKKEVWFGPSDKAKAAAQADYERPILSVITTRPASEVRAEAHAAAIEAAVGAALRAISVKGSGYRDENERLLSRVEREMKLELAKALRTLHTDASRAYLAERDERIKREAREEALREFMDAAVMHTIQAHQVIFEHERAGDDKEPYIRYAAFMQNLAALIERDKDDD